MPHRLARRAALFVPFLLAACGDDDEPAPSARRDFPPLRYGYLPPISLAVQRMETGGEFVPPSGDDEVSGLTPVNIGDTLFAMARDRLKPVGNDGVATFRIVTASIIRRHDTLNGTLAVRLDVHNGDDTNSGYVVAHVTATKPVAGPDLRATIYDMFKSMMDNMNVELEYQLRNKLRPWLVVPAAEPSVVPPPPPPPPRT